MKKLLVIAPQNPYPATDGGKISIYYPLINLAQYFEIHFVFPYFQELPSNIVDHFASFNIKIYPQLLNTSDSIFEMLFKIFSPLPYKFQKYCSQTILRELHKTVEQQKIELVLCNHSHVAWYALKLRDKYKVKIFLREHNIEYWLVQQVLIVNKNPILRSYIRWQYLKTKNYEVNCWKKFDKTFFISDLDFAAAKTVCAACDKLDLLYDSFTQKNLKSSEKKEPYSFIFTGSVATFQNSYNLQKFVTEIWKPLIQTDIKWKLYITGNKDGELEKRIKIDLAANNIINLGFVDDIDRAISSKKYFISPTYVGSGIRIKVINAMAGGAVCFLTPLDANMLTVLNDFDNIIKFNNFIDFYSKLLRLESDEYLYNSISLHASRVSLNFTWQDYALKIFNESRKL